MFFVDAGLFMKLGSLRHRVHPAVFIKGIHGVKHPMHNVTLFEVGSLLTSTIIMRTKDYES